MFFRTHFYVDVTEYLVRAGADPTLRNKAGYTALSYLRRWRADTDKTVVPVHPEIDNIIRYMLLYQQNTVHLN